MKILTDKMEDLLYEYMETYHEEQTIRNGERLCTVLDAVLSLAEEPDDKQDKQDEQDKLFEHELFTPAFAIAERKAEEIRAQGYEAKIFGMFGDDGKVLDYRVEAGDKVKENG